MTWIEIEPESEPPRIPYEWDAPRKTRGRLGAVVLAISTVLATLCATWAAGPDAETLTCSRRAEGCIWIERRNYEYHFGLPRGARVERGPEPEDGEPPAGWRAVIVTFGVPISTTELPDRAAVEAFAAEVNAFVADDAPKLEAVLTIPAQRDVPIAVFVTGLVLLVAWVGQNVRGTLRDLFGSAPVD
jgi:hypothetical protein